MDIHTIDTVLSIFTDWSCTTLYLCPLMSHIGRGSFCSSLLYCTWYSSNLITPTQTTEPNRKIQVLSGFEAAAEREITSRLNRAIRTQKEGEYSQAFTVAVCLRHPT